MVYYRRSAWTSTSNRAVSTKRKQVHATLHYPGWGTNSIRTANWSRERCFQQLRAWRNMHVGSGAYREVAYNLYALPTGDVAEGRGNRQNGANGTSASNRAGMSVQVLIGDNEPLTEGHLKAVFAALALLESWHPGITKRQYGHSHWVSTACPGRHVRAGIPYRVGSKPSTGSGGSVKPPVKADPNRQWRTSPRVSRMTKAEIRTIQRELVGAGYSVGSYGVDGSYGDDTGRAVKALQADLGITSDGIYGPGTEKALMALKDDIKKLDKKVQAFGEQNQWRLDTLPQRILDEPIKLAGMHEGQTSTLRTKAAWQGHNFTQAHQMIAASQAAVTKAVQEAGRAQGLTDEQVQEIAAAAADAAARVSAEDVAAQLEVGVKEG